MSDISKKPGFGFLTRSDSSQPEQLHILERLSVEMLFEIMMFFIVLEDRMSSIISLMPRSWSDFEFFSPVTRKPDLRGFDHLGHKLYVLYSHRR